MNYTKLEFLNVDGYIIITEHNRRYLTNFHSSFGIFFMTKNTQYYLTDSRYLEVCKKHFENSAVQVEIVKGFAGSIERINEIIKDESLNKIGFEEIISVQDLDFLKENMNVEFVKVEKEIEEIRSVKTLKELEKITHSMKVASSAFSAFIKKVRVGMTEKELKAILNYEIFSHGADNLAFDTIIASGGNGSRPHAIPTDKKIEQGDLITCDFGAQIDGYCSDITRTFAVGEVSEKQNEVYNLVKKACETALSAVKEGRTTGEIDKIARDIIEEAGYGKYFSHGLGHGVGVEIHEAPRVAMNTDTVLKENMVITIEPGIYISGKLGVRIEDTVSVTKDGIINMNPLSKDLIKI